MIKKQGTRRQDEKTKTNCLRCIDAYSRNEAKDNLSLSLLNESSIPYFFRGAI